MDTGVMAATIAEDMRRSGFRRKKIMSNQVFGMIIFVLTEVMFFTALISSYMVIKGDESRFSIPANIKLPVLTTAYNTAILFLSGLALFLAGRKCKDMYLSSSGQMYYIWAILLGGFFVAFQGYEWLSLLSFGLTMKSSIFGALFFLLIGTHGLHAVIGILFLLALFVRRRGRVFTEDLKAAQVFWYFIVGIWPFLYRLVYF